MIVTKETPLKEIIEYVVEAYKKDTLTHCELLDIAKQMTVKDVVELITVLEELEGIKPDSYKIEHTNLFFTDNQHHKSENFHFAANERIKGKHKYPFFVDKKWHK